MKIFEFQPGIGTFSAGLEYFHQHEVVQIQKITPQECISYNLSHLNKFVPQNINFIDCDSLIKHDFAVLKPNFGISLTQKRTSVLKMDELYSCLEYIAKYRPKIVVIITPPRVIKDLNYNHSYVTDGFGMVSKDVVIQSLQSCDYMAWQLVIDQVQCGVPMFYPVNFYVGIDQTLGDVRDTQSPTIWYGSGSGKMPYNTVADAIMDLDDSSDEYMVDPLNTYQAWCRKYTNNIVRNHEPNYTDVKSSKRSIFSRPANIGNNFHLPNGLGFPCHPSLSRSFTMREGMRLHGIPDHIYLLDSLSYKNQANMIHEQISPLTALNLMELIQPYL